MPKLKLSPIAESAEIVRRNIAVHSAAIGGLVKFPAVARSGNVNNTCPALGRG